MQKIERKRYEVDKKDVMFDVVGQPIEYSFFYGGAYDKLVNKCTKLLGIQPYSYTAKDLYFDKEGRDLFKQDLSLRVRKINNSKEKYFVLMVDLIPGSKENPTGAKETVHVQEINEKVYPSQDLIKRYQDDGLKKVANIHKRRTAFVIEQVSFQRIDDGLVVSGFPDDQGSWISKNYGLRLLIDEFEEPINSYPMAIEVEFGDSQRDKAGELRDQLLTFFKDELIPKGSKIEYFQPDRK